MGKVAVAFVRKFIDNRIKNAECFLELSWGEDPLLVGKVVFSVVSLLYEKLISWGENPFLVGEIVVAVVSKFMKYPKFIDNEVMT